MKPASEVLYGRKVLAVRGSEDSMRIYLDDGHAYQFDLQGDCCSHSSFTPEGIEAFKELIGSVILKMEERTNDTEDDKHLGLDKREEKLIIKYPPSEADSWHFLVFTTDKGYVTIDWRNESNGYYDGWIGMTTCRPLDGADHDSLLMACHSMRSRLGRRRSRMR